MKSTKRKQSRLRHYGSPRIVTNAPHTSFATKRPRSRQADVRGRHVERSAWNAHLGQRRGDKNPVKVNERTVPRKYGEVHSLRPCGGQASRLLRIARPRPPSVRIVARNRFAVPRAAHRRRRRRSRTCVDRTRPVEIRGGAYAEAEVFAVAPSSSHCARNARPSTCEIADLVVFESGARRASRSPMRVERGLEIVRGEGARFARVPGRDTACLLRS